MALSMYKYVWQNSKSLPDKSSQESNKEKTAHNRAKAKHGKHIRQHQTLGGGGETFLQSLQQDKGVTFIFFIKIVL